MISVMKVTSIQFQIYKADMFFILYHLIILKQALFAIVKINHDYHEVIKGLNI